MYKSLQACRAFAAILVVLYHLGLTISKEKYFGLDFQESSPVLYS